MENQNSSAIKQEKEKNQNSSSTTSAKQHVWPDEQAKINSIQDFHQFQMDENEQSDYFQNEANLGNDQRIMIPSNTIHPYCGIGKLVVEFEYIKTQKTFPSHGTAFIISKEYIMTAFHVLKVPQCNIKNIHFYPEVVSQSEVSKKAIKAKIFIWDQKYLSPDIKDKRPYDYAVLKLEPNSIITQEHSLKCNFNYQFQKYQHNPINIPGYPNQPQINKLIAFGDYQNKYALFQDQKYACSQSDYRLQYKHSTNKGTSGAPLLMKTQSGSYDVVGLHLGTSGKLNAGILLNKLSLKQQIIASIPLADSSKSASAPVPLETRQLISKFSDSSSIPIITNQQFIALAVIGHKFSQLQTIEISGNKITDAGLEALAVNGHKFSQLQAIILTNNKITDAGLVALAVNGHKFSRLKAICLQDNEIKDAGLKALAVNGHKFSQLQKIHLRDNKITDAGLEALAVNGHNFSQLQEIHIWYNKIASRYQGKSLNEIFSLKELSKSRIRVWS